MKLRSITYFIDPSFPVNPLKMKSAGEFLRTAQPNYEEAGYEVQTARLASVPFPQLLAGQSAHALVKLACELEVDGRAENYAYVSLGPAFPDDVDCYTAIPDALAATENAFFSGSMTTSSGKISLPAVRQNAQVIQRASLISADGFGNLRFAALANVPAGSPFFPAAYHRNSEPSFALATEAADLALAAFNQAGSLEEARMNLVHSMESHAQALTNISRRVEKLSGVRFGGIDFSLAPFPSQELSIGTALERLGVPKLGEYGSLTTAAILAETMDRAEFMRAGFSGLLLPVLEDATLARRAEEGSLGVKDLLLYSCVCGTGLDCIPLPGDTSAESLSAVLIDLASLSSRLGKPLTARLMPIPGKKAGDPTGFDWEFFANSRILPISATPLTGFLAGDEVFALKERYAR
jgi:uncharacterized protein (UPF0210 family)